MQITFSRNPHLPGKIWDVISQFLSRPGRNLEEEPRTFFTTKARGTGLGSAAVRKIIGEHHGTVSIESRINIGEKVSIKLLQTR